MFVLFINSNYLTCKRKIWEQLTHFTIVNLLFGEGGNGGHLFGNGLLECWLLRATKRIAGYHSRTVRIYLHFDKIWLLMLSNIYGFTHFTTCFLNSGMYLIDRQRRACSHTNFNFMQTIFKIHFWFDSFYCKISIFVLLFILGLWKWWKHLYKTFLYRSIRVRYVTTVFVYGP